MAKSIVLHINCNYIYTSLHQLLVNELEQLGINNTVFVPVVMDAKPRIQIGKNVFVLYCLKHIDRYIYHYKQNKIFNVLKKQINLSNFNCIHAHTLFTDGGVAFKIKKMYGIPYIVAVRNTDLNFFLKYFFWLRPYGRKILSEASAIVFLSPIYKEQLFDLYLSEEEKSVLSSKSYIIPNGIDSFWLNNEPSYKSDDEQIIKCVYAGAINRNKNVLSTMKACDILRKRGYEVEYSVIGKVEDQRVLSKLLKDGKVYYHPAIPKEELIHFYRCNDVFVMPSYAETFGLVYAEAMSQGLPIIYSKGQGFDQQFADGMIGYSVKSDSPEDIAEKILICYQKRKQLFNECIGASKKFDWKKIAIYYKKLYDEIEDKSCQRHI